MYKDDLVKGGHLRLVVYGGDSLGTRFLVWFAIGEVPVLPNYRFGAYHVGPKSV